MEAGQCARDFPAAKITAALTRGATTTQPTRQALFKTNNQNGTKMKIEYGKKQIGAGLGTDAAPRRHISSLFSVSLFDVLNAAANRNPRK